MSENKAEYKRELHCISPDTSDVSLFGDSSLLTDTIALIKPRKAAKVLTTN